MLEKLLNLYIRGVRKSVDKAETEFMSYWNSKYPFSVKDASPDIVKLELLSWMHVGGNLSRGIEGMVSEPGEFGFMYKQFNVSVKELVSSKGGNCVAYTTLYVLLARRFGITMHSLHVTEQEGDMWMDCGHACPIDNDGFIYDATGSSVPVKGKYKGIIMTDRMLLVMNLFGSHDYKKQRACKKLLSKLSDRSDLEDEIYEHHFKNSPILSPRQIHRCFRKNVKSYSKTVEKVNKEEISELLDLWG